MLNRLWQHDDLLERLFLVDNQEVELPLRYYYDVVASATLEVSESTTIA
jgi:hypothetical protein